MAPTRKSAKKMALWLAPDDATTPTSSHKVAFVRTQGFTISRPSTDVTAAEDTAQEHLAGIPGGTLQVAGVSNLETPGGALQLVAAAKDGAARNARLVYDVDETGDYLEATVFVENLAHNGDYAGTFTFSATLRATGDFNAVAAV